MTSVKEKIENLVADALKKMGVENPIVPLEHPADLSHGDYSTNVALVYGKELGRNPKEVASEIVEALRQAQGDFGVAKIEIAGPGFINFHLSREFFAESVQEILDKGENFGKSENLKGQKTIIEYTDPNPFKEFHIGHLMSNAVGETLSRIIEWNGAEVKRANYQGDVGLHVAKAIWGMKQNGYQVSSIEYQEAVKSLGEAYAAGSKAYEEDENAKKEILEINKKIYERSDEEVNRLYDEGKKISLEYFETIYKKLGTAFDFYFFESESGEFGKKTVLEFLKKNVFEESDGAVVFKGENYDKSLHTRVFINKEGLPTYEAKELGLAKIKHEKYPYEKSIVITGNEVDAYFKVVLKAMGQVFPELAAKTVHKSHGMLRLPSGKMSSRTGDVVTAEFLLEKVEEMVLEKMKDRDILGEEKTDAAEKVAVAAIKYSILKQAIGRDIIFDFEKSLSFEGDSGPYLQYSYVRAGSVLEKAKNENIHLDVGRPSDFGEPAGLERLLYRFPEIIHRAGEEYAPQYLVTYLIELASEFNSFYAQEKIVDKNDESSPYKIALTTAFQTVIKNGLTILGIKVPRSM